MLKNNNVMTPAQLSSVAERSERKAHMSLSNICSCEATRSTTPQLLQKQWQVSCFLLAQLWYYACRKEGNLPTILYNFIYVLVEFSSTRIVGQQFFKGVRMGGKKGEKGVFCSGQVANIHRTTLRKFQCRNHRGRAMLTVVYFVCAGG